MFIYKFIFLMLSTRKVAQQYNTYVKYKHEHILYNMFLEITRYYMKDKN